MGIIFLLAFLFSLGFFVVVFVWLVSLVLIIMYFLLNCTLSTLLFKFSFYFYKLGIKIIFINNFHQKKSV